MSVFRPLRVERSHGFVVALPLERAFALFEPEGERLWARGWNPTYLHPADGKAVAGMVFTTGRGDEHTIWTLVRYQPRDGLLEYVRTTPASRTGTVLVHCTRLDEGRTRVNVAYALTALSESGNEALRKMDEAQFKAYIDSWDEDIARAIARQAGKG